MRKEQYWPSNLEELEVKEKLLVEIGHQAAYKVINKSILSEDEGVRNRGISIITAWILSLLEGREGCRFALSGCWLVEYNKGDETQMHTHHPFSYAFVYFVKAPKGSSPLVLTTSGRRIRAEEGKLILKGGDIWHHVPKNKCDGRIVLAGNITAIPDNEGSINSHYLTSNTTLIK